MPGLQHAADTRAQRPAGHHGPVSTASTGTITPPGKPPRATRQPPMSSPTNVSAASSGSASCSGWLPVAARSASSCSPPATGSTTTCPTDTCAKTRSGPAGWSGRSCAPRGSPRTSTPRRPSPTGSQPGGFPSTAATARPPSSTLPTSPRSPLRRSPEPGHHERHYELSGPRSLSPDVVRIIGAAIGRQGPHRSPLTRTPISASCVISGTTMPASTRCSSSAERCGLENSTMSRRESRTRWVVRPRRSKTSPPLLLRANLSAARAGTATDPGSPGPGH